MSNFESLIKIGKGSFANVYRAMDTDNDEHVAIKLMLMEGPDHVVAETSKSFVDEVYALEELRHPNIVCLLGKHVADSQLYMVLEYAATDLHRWIKNHITTTPAQIKAQFEQILTGVAFIHKKGFVHRDLKPANILVMEDGTIKIADFGCATVVPDDGVPHTQEVVTRWYRSPELIVEFPTYGQSIDVWSLGCIYAEMTRGRVLFAGRSTIDQLLRIFGKLGTPTDWPAFDAHMKDKVVFQHIPRTIEPWKKANMDLLYKMLVYDPEKRITAQHALELLTN